MNYSTLLIHNGHEIDKETGALSLPIYQTSTFHQNNIDKPQKFDYSRSGNPTREALEETIAKLESGKKGFAFSSGMAAISSVLSIFSAGDHLIVCSDAYGGTFRITHDFFPRFDLDITYVDMTDTDAVRLAVKKNTKAIFIETPSNPLMKITDIREIVKIASLHGLITIADNTFMSPYLQRPLELGVDIVVHSATKFIGGHSDVIAGLAVAASDELAKKIYRVQNSFGAILGPQDSWLLLRGLKTLKVRLDYQQSSAIKLANWLQSQSNVEKVYYPGLKSQKGYELHKSQSFGPGAVLSFKTKDVQKAIDFTGKITLAAVAVSLGGVETIVSYPVKMSHASMPKPEREARGITENLLRVSVGLEDPDDLIADFNRALNS